MKNITKEDESIGAVLAIMIVPILIFIMAFAISVFVVIFN